MLSFGLTALRVKVGQSCRISFHPAVIRSFCLTTPCRNSNLFDEKMLDILVCPLSKKPLRYDKEKNELISDAINVAYPIVNGIPNLVPQDARIIKKADESESPKT